MSISSYEVIIVGGGPAGATAAICLGKIGVSTLLVDKAVFPRDKICGDALSGKVVEYLKKIDASLLDSLEAEVSQVGSHGVIFGAPNQKTIRIPFRSKRNTITEAPGYISKRVHFDDYLLRKALASSWIDSRMGNAVKEYKKKETGYVCELEDGEVVEAKMLIISDGAQSGFARKIHGFNIESKHYCAGIRTYWKGVTGMDKENYIELHFLKDLLPGYFWIFALPNGEANVGLGIRSDVVKRKRVSLTKELFRVVKEHPLFRERFLNAQMMDEPKGFGLPLGTKKRLISGERYLLTGDAASLIDPFTGEGIGNAMVSGYYASKQVEYCLKHNDFSADIMKRYDDEVYERLWPELRLGKIMQRLVESPLLFNLVVNRAQKSEALRNTISCMFDDLDLRKELRKPSFYINLLFK